MKKTAIGIIAASFHSDYSRTIVTEICECFRQEQIELHLYLGMNSSRFLAEHSEEDKIRTHYFSFFGYTNFDELELLIISSEALTVAGNAMELSAFLSRLPKVPKILLGMPAAGEGNYGVVTDHYTGMKRCIEHLITEHGCQKIAFLSGPKTVPNAVVRLDAYRDVLREHGLLVEEDWIAYGNFTAQCEKQVEQLLAKDELPDAIVAANDEMAASVYRVLKQRGLEPGEDVLVTGYDDVPIARVMDPPLTTVHQNFKQIVPLLKEKVLELLSGKSPEFPLIQPKLMVRCSCGCNKGYQKLPQDVYDARGSILFTEYEELKKTHLREMKAALMLRSLLLYPVTVKQFFTQLAEQFQTLGITHSAVSLLEEPVELDGTDPMFIPEKQRLVMVLKPGRIHTYDMEEADILYSDHLREAKKARRHIQHEGFGTWCTFLLYHNNVQYGSWMVLLSPEDVPFYYTLSLELGSALRYLNLALAQQKIQRELREQNQILSFSSQHDTLTGLYNRAGLLKKLFEQMHAKGSDHTMAAFIADLDHLKQINDTYGHNDGDFAIITAAKILKEAAGENGIAGRMGGDEFIVILNAAGEETIRAFKDQVRDACAAFNKKNEKPYYIEISLGFHIFSPVDADEITEVFKMADADLYEAKKKRRANVIRV